TVIGSAFSVVVPRISVTVWPGIRFWPSITALPPLWTGARSTPPALTRPANSTSGLVKTVSARTGPAITESASAEAPSRARSAGRDGYAMRNSLKTDQDSLWLTPIRAGFGQRATYIPDRPCQL